MRIIENRVLVPFVVVAVMLMYRNFFRPETLKICDIYLNVVVDLKLRKEKRELH